MYLEDDVQSVDDAWDVGEESLWGVRGEGKWGVD